MKPHILYTDILQWQFSQNELVQDNLTEFWQLLTSVGAGHSLKVTHSTLAQKLISYFWQYHTVAISYEQKTPAMQIGRKWWVILNNLWFTTIQYFSYCCCAIVRLDVCVFLALKNSECLAQLTNSSLNVCKGMLANPLRGFFTITPDIQFSFLDRRNFGLVDHSTIFDKYLNPIYGF